MRYRRKKFTFAISSPDEFSSTSEAAASTFRRRASIEKTTACDGQINGPIQTAGYSILRHAVKARDFAVFRLFRHTCLVLGALKMTDLKMTDQIPDLVRYRPFS